MHNLEKIEYNMTISHKENEEISCCNLGYNDFPGKKKTAMAVYKALLTKTLSSTLQIRLRGQLVCVTESLRLV